MIEIGEAELPGIGKKYTIEQLKDGGKLVLLLHNSGRRDIYYFEKGKESPTVVSLNDEEARRIGAILEGAFFKPTPTDALEFLLSELIIEWVKLKPGVAALNRTIGELEIRKKTGVSIIAILRKPKNIPNPTPDVALQEDDTLVVIGRREQFPAFQKLIGVE